METMVKLSDEKDTALSAEELADIKPLCDKIKTYFSSADISLIEKAYLFSKRAHEGQFRRSGEPYIYHPIGVAEILAELRLDIPTIITGLLHDTVEDTDVTLHDVEEQFGSTVAHLVDGVTKISQINFRNKHEKQSENFRKMIVAMGKDIRVILVKLADRLHNMRTLSHMPYEKQTLIGQETLDIYAPLASRLGISEMKIELEDLSFRFTNPDMFYDLVQKVQKKKKEREKYIEDVIRLIQNEFSGKIAETFVVQGRPKHLYSIYKKMSESKIDYEQVYDILAFRIIVQTIPQCYEVLGHIHSLWKPVPGRFKDYIAMPKINGYQSLHTTIMGPGAERIEIQIRTEEMHQVAERGIAAHWKYKEGNKVNDKVMEQMGWLQELVQNHQSSASSGEFLENVKTDLLENQIYVFTPNGDLKELPDGATSIDFAFAIHTDVGTHCVSCKVNGRMVPLKTKLMSGDTVEIVTSKSRTPSKDWLKICVTSKAKARIRAFIQNEERNKAFALGKELLEKEFRKHGVSLQKYLKPSIFTDNEIIRKTGSQDLDDLHVRVGYGRVLPKVVVEALVSDLKPITEAEPEGVIQKIYNSALKRKKQSKSIISVDGIEDMLVHFGKCCSPIPGDSIRGFISRGRGITIHRSDCEKIFAIDKRRELEVEWTVKSAPEGVERTVRLQVVAQDIPGLLKSMSEAFSMLGMNIMNAQIRTTKDKKAICLFDVSVKDISQMNLAIHNLQKIKGVMEVSRVSQL